MEHQKINGGWEHNVYQAKKSESLILKTPKLTTRLLFTLSNTHADFARIEHEAVERSIQGTKVKLPKWRIFVLPQFRHFPMFPHPTAYVTVQEKIITDNSVPDIPDLLRSEGLIDLLYRYYINPDNFISKGGLVYYVDPTEGISPAKIFENKGIISKKRYRRIHYLIQKDLRLRKLLAFLK